MISGVTIQVAAAKSTTTPSVRPVFWTTESIVIRPWSTGAVTWPGAPVPHWEGSV